MAIGQQANEQTVNHQALADDDLGQFAVKTIEMNTQALNELADRFDVQGHKDPEIAKATAALPVTYYQAEPVS
jgi:hypothetical protein